MRIFDNIRLWAHNRDIITGSNSGAQYEKLLEEIGELGKALINKDPDDVVDAIGDCIVVLTVIASINNVTVEHCLQKVYDVIKLRKGLMIDGKFVKYEDLTPADRQLIDSREAKRA